MSICRSTDLCIHWLPLVCALTGTEPATLAHRDDTLANRASGQGLSGLFLGENRQLHACEGPVLRQSDRKQQDTDAVIRVGLRRAGCPGGVVRNAPPPGPSLPEDWEAGW